MRALYSLGTLFLLTLAGQAASQEGAPDLLVAVERELAAEVSSSILPVLPPGFLAILPPQVESPGTVASEVVSSWEALLIEQLKTANSSVKITERSVLESILREQKFGSSAYADSATGVAVGRLAAASSLLTTEIFTFEIEESAVQVHLTWKLVDVESGEVLAAKTLNRRAVPSRLRFWTFAWVLLVAGIFTLFGFKKATASSSTRTGFAR